MAQVFSLTLRALVICALVILAAIACRQLYLRVADGPDAADFVDPSATMMKHCEAVHRNLDGRRVSEPESQAVKRGRCIDS